MKKFLIMIATVCMSTMIVPFSFAADSLEIIPEAKNPNELGKQVDCVGDASKCTSPTSAKSTVRDRYNRQASGYNASGDLGASFATGIFSWDTIIEYIVYIIKFLSQIGLLIGVIMIIYAGYQYASAIIFDKTPKSDSVTNAIQGVLIVIFSYAIIKALTAAFL